MPESLLTRSDMGVPDTVWSGLPCLAGLLDCLSVLIAPRFGKMGCLGSPFPRLSPLGVAGPFEIQYNAILKTVSEA